MSTAKFLAEGGGGGRGGGGGGRGGGGNMSPLMQIFNNLNLYATRD